MEVTMSMRPSPAAAKERGSGSMPSFRRFLGVLLVVFLQTFVFVVPAVKGSASLPRRQLGPTVLEQQLSRRIYTSRLKTCVEQKLRAFQFEVLVEEGSPQVQNTPNSPCYLAPKVDGGDGSLMNMRAILVFQATEDRCKRFNDKRYEKHLWNEALLNFVQKPLTIPRCPNWQRDPRTLAAISLFWDFAMNVLNSSSKWSFWSSRKPSKSQLVDSLLQFARSKEWRDAETPWPPYADLPMEMYKSAFTKRQNAKMGEVFVKRWMAAQNAIEIGK